MKKVAVCIRGELREWESAYPNILETFNGPEFDFFFTTWDKSTQRTHKADITEHYIRSCFWKRKSNLKAIKIIPFKPVPRLFWCDPITHYMHQQWYECNELKKNYEFEHNIKYDYVIGIRPDVVYCHPVTIEYIELNIRDPFMINSDGFLESNPDYYDMYSPDLFMCTHNVIMNVICNFYLYLINIKNKGNQITIDTTHNSLCYYLQSRGLIFESDYNQLMFNRGQLEIVRSNATHLKYFGDYKQASIKKLQKLSEQWWEDFYSEND